MQKFIEKTLKILSKEDFGSIINRFQKLIDKKLNPHKYFHTINALQKKDILFISGEPKNATSYYRCEIPLEILENAGLTGDIIYYKYISESILENYKQLIWYRTPLEDSMLSLINKVKESGKKIIYSIDDLLFDEESLKDQEWFAKMTAEEQKEQIQKGQQIREFLKISDFGIASTSFLKKEMQKVMGQRQVFVLKNSFSKNDLKLANINNDKQSSITLGFFSGSDTHDADFEIISETLKNLLNANPQVKLILGGRIACPSWAVKMTEQVSLSKFTNHENFMKLIGKCSIILVPFVQNKHNFSKSEIRGAQSGIMKKCVVASKSDAYEELIENNHNGLILSNEEWDSTLSRIINEKDTIKKLGSNLYDKIINEYNHEKLGAELINFLKQIE